MFFQLLILWQTHLHRILVRGIMENKEWMMVNGVWTEKEMDIAQTTIRQVKSRELEEQKLAVFSSFLDKLSKI